jgi:hypothetical protein
MTDVLLLPWQHGRRKERERVVLDSNNISIIYGMFCQYCSYHIKVWTEVLITATAPVL